MKTLVVLSLIMSASLFAQTRVRENIKQQTITNEDGTSTVVKEAPAKTTAPATAVKAKQKK